MKVEYKVTNLSNDTMYFNVGAHEAYSAPEGIEDYDITKKEGITSLKAGKTFNFVHTITIVE